MVLRAVELHLGRYREIQGDTGEMVLRAVARHLQVLPYLLHRQLIVVVRAALVGPLLV